MASKTQLLDLPNELFPFIFQYLKSIDILKSFSNLKSFRLQALIQPFITRLDISQESNEWIETNLLNVFTQYEIIASRVQMKHLAFLSEHLLSTNIQALQVINWNFDFDLSEEVMGQLRRNLKELLFLVPELDESSDLPGQLFRSDSQLERLTIPDCVLYLDADAIVTCTHLTHLSVQLEGMDSVFILIKHLPCLQELKVKIRSQECFVQSPPNTTGVKPCNTLRSVTFTGWIKYYDHLETFFTTFGSTIECLTLNIHLMYFIMDGKRLECELLDKMPRLSILDLIIFSAVVDHDPIEIETFRSSKWQRFNPIVYWNDIHVQQHTIFTFPYKSDKFESLSNDCISTCVSNRPVSLGFKRVRMLSLINTTPLNLETFLFIRKVFPNITTVELKDWIVHPLAEEEEEEEEKFLSISESLLSDVSLQIPSVIELCISVGTQYIDYKSFYRLFNLFPNLISLELSIQRPLLRDVLKHAHDDSFVKNVFSRVKQLKISYWHGEDILSDAEIHYLFPNAKNYIKPDFDYSE